MASLFKPNINAYTLDGSHRTPDGKRVTAKTAGAVKQTRKGRTWYGKFAIGDGAFKTVRLCSDKVASQQLLAKMVLDAKMQSEGIGDPFAEPKKKPLHSHLEDYQAHLEGKNDCPQHVTQTITQCRTILRGTQAKGIGDLDADRISAFLKQRRDANDSFGISTSNAYMIAIKGFARWLHRSRRSPVDALIHMSRLNASTDVRRQRRPLRPEEASALLEAAKRSTDDYRGLTGLDRYMIYATALQTGLRSGELRSLTPESFNLDEQPPTLSLSAAYSKRRRNDVQPLPAELATALRNYLAVKPTGKPIWPGSWHKVAWRMIAKDLVAAGIEQETEDGTVDFHATRHSYITHLAMSGVHPKMAQSLARHSSITLTMDRYSHVGLMDQAAALEALPSLIAPKSESLTLKATGTDSTPARPDHGVTNLMRNHDLPVTTPDNSSSGIHNSEDCRKSLRMPTVENAGEGERSGDKRVTEGIRTPDFQSHSLNAQNHNPLPVTTCDESDLRRDHGVTKVSENDPDLANVIASWPSLPEAIKRAILAMVESQR